MITSRNDSCKKIVITFPFLVTKYAPFSCVKWYTEFNQGPVVWRPISTNPLERVSYDLELKTREQNRNNELIEIERFDWFIERV